MTNAETIVVGDRTYHYDGEHLYSSSGTRLSGKYRHFRDYKSGKTLQVARVIWEGVFGKIPDNHEIDHIDGDSTNNRIYNLRCVTKSENMKNRAMHSNVKTGIMGVQWKRTQGKWDSGIAGKRLYWGDDFFEACCVRKSAEVQNNYHHNHGRPRK